MCEVIYAYFYNWDESHDLVLIVYALVELIIEASHLTKDYLIVDIHTQHTCLCSINAIFIYVIVLDKMCFHMLNLCWFKYKKIFECFNCFWKVFFSHKNRKFQKQCFPVLATQSHVSQVACHNRELAGQFWRLVREWKVQLRGVHKDFHGLARDSLTSETSSREKQLANFSKLLN